MNNDTYIFMSRSGGGKGTQIALLEEYLRDKDVRDIYHLEVGDRFRSFFAEGSHTSELAKEITNSGGLQPSFLAVWAWGGELIAHLKENQTLFIDGIPRLIGEAKMLDEALKFYKRNKVKVVIVDVSREWSIERMLERKREDDKTIEARKKRLDWFDDEVTKVIEFFENDSDYEVIRVNGEQPIKDVHDEVIEKLGL